MGEANQRFLDGDWADAARTYVDAASVAPTQHLRKYALEHAWMAQERSRGQVSELEY
jgi:hypothetical protein